MSAPFALQECIPIGCVLPAHWPYPAVIFLWGGGLSNAAMYAYPTGCRTPLVMWPVMHAGRLTPHLWKEWHTGLKTLPCPKLRLRVVYMQPSQGHSHPPRKVKVICVLLLKSRLYERQHTVLPFYRATNFNARVEPSFSRMLNVAVHTSDVLWHKNLMKTQSQACWSLAVLSTF